MKKNNKKSLKEKLKEFHEKTIKQQITIITPYILVCFLCCRIAELYRLCNGNLTKIVKNLAYLYKIFPAFMPIDIIIGIIVGCSIIWYIKFENDLHRKNTRQGEEYGASR